MKRCILNVADVALKPWGRGDKFEAKLGEIGGEIGSEKLGYMLTVVPPGKRAFPFHNHRVNEEMFFVLEGSGEVRIGAERFPIRAGDVIACPPGGRDTAHQIINTAASGELKYLGVSTMLLPEIVDYPDSNKTGIRAKAASLDGKDEGVRILVRGEAVIKDYWEGE
jgi:uncharacterized cupin superfamily protein